MIFNQPTTCPICAASKDELRWINLTGHGGGVELICPRCWYWVEGLSKWAEAVSTLRWYCASQRIAV